MQKRANNKNHENSISYRHISLKTLVISLSSFIVGIVSSKLVENQMANEQSIFSTMDIVSFTLTLIVSGASIILAIAAIQLGKLSEVAIIQRNDESIRLQNEIHSSTTDALIKIQSSTGVTEKRIEDIIEGRVSLASEKIANIAYNQNPYTDKEAFKKEIQESLIKDILLNSESKEEHDNTDSIEKEKERERGKIYQNAHNRIMNLIKSKAGVIVGKIGHGNPAKTGDDIFDGIFLYNNSRIGVTTYFEDYHERMLIDFTNKAVKEIVDENYNYVRVYCLYTSDREKMERLIENCNMNIPNLYKYKFNFEILNVADSNFDINELNIA